MLLETLKDFDWYNEPQKVRFDESGMHVAAKMRSDFWACARYDFCKDDGHFFFSYIKGDFICDLNWSCADADLFNQCGIMVRLDEKNWFKASVMYESNDSPMLATSLTCDGYSDLATLPLTAKTDRVWYRLQKRKGCYVAYYSLDGENFIQMRKFYLAREKEEVMAGAYICSPQSENFEALLHDLQITKG